MDQQFRTLFASRLTARPIALDHAQLIAGLAAQQAASPTGRAATLLASPARPVLSPAQALIVIFAGEPGWAGAVPALAGRFHPDVRFHAPSIARQHP